MSDEYAEPRTSQTLAPAPAVPRERFDLEVGGMTCASCAMRVEKKLNKLDGVHASVNYATEKARVEAPAGTSVEDLIAVVKATGYTARVPAPPRIPGSSKAGDRTAPGDGAAFSAGSSGPANAVGTTGDEAAPSAQDLELASLRQRLIVSAVLAVPVVVISMVPALQFEYWQWAMLTLTSPGVVWGALPFHRAALLNARHGAATMDTLISVGTAAAYVWSLYALFLGTAGEPGMKHAFEFSIEPTDGAANMYLEAAAGVIVFVLLGRYFEKSSKRRAGAALKALLELGAKDVTVLRGDVETTVAIDQLAVDDLFVVRPGEKVATDGVVVEGASAIDESMISGESVPVDVAVGDAVVGATVNRSGRLVVRASRVGADTQLAQMAQLVEDAQSGKAEVQRLADRVSGVFVPIVIALAVATLGVWLGGGFPPSAAFTAAVAVLINACPCALGLATPTALLVGTGRGAQLGVLIRGPEVLESTRRVDTIVLDKTGTVTTGKMTLVGVCSDVDTTDDEILRVAGAVEAASEHPIAQAVARGALERVGGLPTVQDFSALEGRGVRGAVDGRAVLIGRERLLEAEGVAVSEAVRSAREAAEARGETAVIVAWDGVARGVVGVADAIKPTSARAISELRALGLTPILLTGDNATVAAQVGAEVGIDEVIAEVLPSEKVDVVARLQRDGKVVAMVGDGVNDAPALAQADLGLSMGTGTDVAIEASDITLVSGDLRAAVDAIRLSRRTLRTITSNLFWAFAYNVAAIPLAAFGLLNPMLAGAAMAASSVFVVSNSLRLRRFRSVSGAGS